MPPHPLKEIAPLTWSNGHLRFDPSQRRSGKPAWRVILAASDPDCDPVAHIRWHGLWGEYVLFTRRGYIFAHDCLADIAELLQKLNSGPG
jgi:hypothetical protein